MSFVNGKQIVVRTFGWVQDPGKFDNLKNVVATFYFGSSIHQQLVNEIIPNIVEERDGRDKFIAALIAQPVRLKYEDLIGTSFQPRSSARCNGIIQAVLPGQRRPFQGDWPANNFVRWAHALSFITYDYETDTFEITEAGRNYVDSQDGSAEEESILTTALLSYPPVMRILNLLSDGSHLTKFELGSKLGFIGEDGFTTLPQNILLESLSEIDDSKEKNKMKTDWDGSSDKYARMICSWCIAMGWVKKESKCFLIETSTGIKTEEIGQAYKITNKGLGVRRRGLGINIASRITKNVYWELFATKCPDKVYVRTRRAHTLKILDRATGLLTTEAIKRSLHNVGLDVNIETINDDIKGLENIGLNIERTRHGYRLKDNIADFIIPELTVDETRISDVLRYKEDCRSQLAHIPHEYLSLIDMAFDNEQNRIFEMQTIKLFVSECGFRGKHLGGGRKPDGIVYRDEEQCGIIIDNKAYSTGYNLPINQADEMSRYIRENQTRSVAINPNQWWNNFSAHITTFSFAFISSLFKGNFRNQLRRIALDTGVSGAAINVVNLLLLAEKIKSNKIAYQDVFNQFSSNDEIAISY